MTYDSRHIANYLLDKADSINLPLTQISLQKTVFYSHGWYLVLREKPLINDEIEAWTYGPVIRSLRENFRIFGRARIVDKRAYFYDPITDETRFEAYDIAVGDREFLDRMLSFYGKMDPSILIKMTHREGSPWDKVMSAADHANLGRVIPNPDIAKYFERLLRRIPQNEVGALRERYKL